ncbi:hypothetical protein BY996DRAFT_6463904 [Phakopsora pachyrhizi]|nr:hypothetical protein BY996DRAFT_6463904 [Phakopsora pachyrhizi]
MKLALNYPSLFKLTFQVPPEKDSPNKSPSTSKLAFDNLVNQPVQVFKESLLHLQIDLDGIILGGNEQIKTRRKQLIKEVVAELEKLDCFSMRDALRVVQASIINKDSKGRSSINKDLSIPHEGPTALSLEDSNQRLIFNSTLIPLNASTFSIAVKPDKKGTR